MAPICSTSLYYTIMHLDVGKIYSSHSFVLALQPFILVERQGMSKLGPKRFSHYCQTCIIQLAPKKTCIMSCYSGHACHTSDLQKTPKLDSSSKVLNFVAKQGLIEVKCYKFGKSCHFGLLTPDLGLFYTLLPLCRHLACWDKNLSLF